MSREMLFGGFLLGMKHIEDSFGFISQDDVKRKGLIQILPLACFWTKCERFALYSFIIDQEDRKTFEKPLK